MNQEKYTQRVLNTMQSAQQNAAGAIIGSKFVTLLREKENPTEAVEQLLEDLKK